MKHAYWSSLLWSLVACAAAKAQPESLPSVPESAQAAQAAAPDAAQHGHDHHHHSGAPGAVKQDDEVRAEFEVNTIAAHQAMAREMGIQWTPEPDKDSHLSVTLSRVQGGVLRGLSVELSVTDPTGHVSKRIADVMSAPEMYHYGIDFQRTGAGSYGVHATFELGGRTHELGATVALPSTNSSQ